MSNNFEQIFCWCKIVNYISIEKKTTTNIAYWLSYLRLKKSKAAQSTLKR